MTTARVRVSRLGPSAVTSKRHVHRNPSLSTKARRGTSVTGKERDNDGGGDGGLPTSLSLFERLSSLYEDLAGSAEVARLKSAVDDASAAYERASNAALRLRAGAEEAAAAHETVSRRHGDMMRRRHEWALSGEEHCAEAEAEAVERFARLTAEEGRARRISLSARAKSREAEEELGRMREAYVDALRKRYAEEQSFQDRWRVLGTYGTWGLIGLNSAVFLGGQYLRERRESERLEAIERAIDEKLGYVLDATGGARSVDNEDMEPAITTAEAVLPTGENLQEVKDKEAPSEQPTPVPHKRAVNGDGYLGDERKQSSAQVKPAFNAGLSPQAGCDNSTSQSGEEIFPDKFNERSHITPSELHWPSAAAGAIVATFTMLALLSSSTPR